MYIYQKREKNDVILEVFFFFFEWLILRRYLRIYVFNSYSSRTRRIWAGIYNQRGRINVLVNFQAVQ